MFSLDIFKERTKTSISSQQEDITDVLFLVSEWTETASSNSYDVTGLNTDTYYQVHVNVESVSDTFGESEWSDTLYFKTREEDSGTGTSELDTIREQIVS